MRALESVEQSQLRWVQPRAMQRSFELRAGEALVATLSWTGWLSNRAVGHTVSRAWYFDRRGFWNPRVSVEDASSGLQVAHLDYRWRVQGDIVFGPERRVHWRSTNFWQTRWEMLDANGFRVYELHITDQWLRYRADVHLTPEARDAQDLPLLLLTGWYLAYLMKQDAAAGAAAAS